MKSISNAFDSQITLPLQFTYVTLGHQRAEHTLASIGDYLRTTVPTPQAPAMGGGQSPSEHWHSQPRDDGCPEGRLSSRVASRLLPALAASSAADLKQTLGLEES